MWKQSIIIDLVGSPRLRGHPWATLLPIYSSFLFKFASLPANDLIPLRAPLYNYFGH